LLSAYEKKYFIALFAVKKWQYYFLDQYVVIKIDQKVLKHLLEQPPRTMLQNRGFENLTSLDFRIEYKKR